MNKPSWRTKLLTLFTLILVASFVLQVFYVIPYIEERDMQTTISRQEEVAHDIARELDIDLNRLANTLKVIAERAEFRNMEIENQTDVLLLCMNITSEIQNLFVMNETGWFVSGTSENMTIYYTKSYDYQPYFIDSFELGQNHFRLPRSYRNNTIVTTFISVPIESDTGTRVGVLLGTMWLNDLIQNVANYPVEEGELAYLVDTEGTVVAHSEIDLFALEEGPLSLNYSTHPLIQNFTVGETSLTHEYDLNGTLYIGTNVVLESNGWIVVVETPKDTILAESSIMVNNLWLYNIVLFGAALIVTFSFAQQITKQQKQAEDRLVRSERLAVLGQLSGGIGHELRNPLGAIKNAVFLLRMALEHPDQEISETLDILELEVSTSERIISSLLDFARPKPPTRQKIQVNEVINDSISRIQVPDGIEVVYQLEPELPIILADPTQIGQIVTNIGINAVQAMPEGGQLTITTQLVDSGWITMAFTDTGVGIPEEHLHNLYEPLFTTKAKGIGLGLAIIKMMIEAHDGSIEVQSEVGKGTTFTVKLPSSILEGK